MNFFADGVWMVHLAISIKKGKSIELKDKTGASLRFHTLRFHLIFRTILWLAGDNGQIALIKWNK